MTDEEQECFISSDNPFADVGLPNPEECLMQAELLKYILTEIEQRGLSQSQAASLLDVPQSQIRLLLEARLSKIPFQSLVLMVVRLGTNVTTFRQPTTTEPGHIMISLPQSA
jgi:predicted XRE-type DNA-binding protein